jgi:hypothetical protein
MLIVPIHANYEQDLQITRHTTMRTTLDPTRWSEFTADGDTITAQGFCRNDAVIGFALTDADFFDFDAHFDNDSDDSYTAQFTGIPESDTAFIELQLQSGLELRYIVHYSQEFGWYFPEHEGLAQSNVHIIENHEQIRPEITVQYLAGENATLEDVEEVLEEITTLTQIVTAGLNDDYDKARAISEWVSENIYYDHLASTTDVDLETVALSSVLRTRRGICSAYANLTAAMYQAAGLKSVTVIGSAMYLSDFDTLMTDTNRHEWTAFFYEAQNRWVTADTGWDSFNRYDDNGFTSRTAPKRYFDITPLALAQNHRAIKAEYRDYFGAAEGENPYLGSDSGSITIPEEQEQSNSNRTFMERNPIVPYLIPLVIAGIGIAAFIIVHFTLYSGKYKMKMEYKEVYSESRINLKKSLSKDKRKQIKQQELQKKKEESAKRKLEQEQEKKKNSDDFQ